MTKATTSLSAPPPRSRNVLIIGGSGFIGTRLCLRLLALGDKPVVFDRVPPSIAGLEYHRGDMASAADLWRPLLEEADAIVHLAWTTKPQSANDDPGYDLESNVMSGVHLLDGLVRMARRPRLIFASTGGAIYGPTTSALIGEDHPTFPVNAYGVSKLVFEHYLRLYQRNHGLDYLVFRPGNPYGEGQDPRGAQGAIAVFLGRMMRTEPISIWGDGEVVRDYFHVDDLVEALLKGLDLECVADTPRVFNLGSGAGLSLNQLLQHLAAVTGIAADVSYVSARSVDAPRIVLDIGRARHWLDWSPTVGLEDGLRRTWNWLRLQDRA
jgi:UDP-glucose 4-epimerase